MIKKLLILSITSSIFMSSASYADYQVNAKDNGWYRDDGYHLPTNTNIITGSGGFGAGGETRSWFIFDVSSLAAGTAASVTFRANNGYFHSDQGSETISLFDVSTSLSDLQAGTGGVSAFNDLGSGQIFGSYTMSIANFSNMPEFTIDLSSAFLAQLNSVAGSSGGKVAFGVAITTLDSTAPGAFEALWVGSGGGFSPPAYLTVKSVPEPATWAFMMLGFGCIGWQMRRKRASTMSIGYAHARD